MIIWSDIIIAAFEGYIYLSFFSRVFRRKWSLFCIVAAYTAFVTGMILLRMLEINPVVFMLFSVFSSVIFTFFYYTTIMQRILYPCLVTIFNMASEIASGFLLMQIHDISIEDITSEDGLYIVGAIISKLVFFLLVRIVCRFHRRNDRILPFLQWIVVMLIPVVSIAALHGLALTTVGCIMKDSFAACLVLGGIMMINAMVFILYDTLSGQSTRLLEHENEKSRFDLEMQRYEAIVRQSRYMGSIVHDTHNHLRILSSLIDRGDIENTRKYIRRLDKDTHDTYGEQILPGYPAIDIVLRQKISEAQSKNIAVTHEISLFPGLSIEPVDICVVLGNSLDNAIEACVKLETERKIDIKIRFIKNRLIIIISNTSKPVEIINSACSTTKENKQTHGFGFSNMRTTIEKYRGNIIPTYDSGIFILHVMMLI